MQYTNMLIFCRMQYTKLEFKYVYYCNILEISYNSETPNSKTAIGFVGAKSLSLG